MIPARRYLRFPQVVPALPRGRRLAYFMRGLLAFPGWWIAAAIAGAPAMRLRWRSLWTGVRLSFTGGDWATAYRCIVSPFDSVRHFEFDYFWRRAHAGSVATYLDVSSPRLLPLMLLDAHPMLHADIVNPDANDLHRTQTVARSLGVSRRCRFSEQRIGQFEGRPGGYELITCMSVLEHIDDDIGAIGSIWSLLAPGGQMLVSVPCAAAAVEEYSDFDEYGLLPKDRDGFVFWQRYYDPVRLRRLFEVVGEPMNFAVFGERIPGTYDADVAAKRSDPGYPHWRDSLATARGYVIQPGIEGLVGMGVVAMEFVKPQTDVRANGGRA